MKATRKWTATSLVMVLLLAGGGVGLWQRDALTLWYQSWKLQKATPDTLHTFVTRFETHGLAGTEALIRLFRSENEMTCQNAGQVLGRILQLWGEHDSRSQATFKQMASESGVFSDSGQRECLGLMLPLIKNGSPTTEMTLVIGSLAARWNGTAETRLMLLDTMTVLLRQEQVAVEGFMKQAKACVQAGIMDENTQVRLASIRLAVTPALQLHAKLAPLVTGSTIDRSPEVRQLALLALGEHEQLLSTDELCKLLQDNDDQVRNIAERALKLRGLNQNQLRLARMMNDPNPEIRASLPALVFATPEVDAVQWMERLCKDANPAVRAASARAMGDQSDQRLQTLMLQLSDKDQDPSVQQIARFYGKVSK